MKLVISAAQYRILRNLKESSFSKELVTVYASLLSSKRETLQSGNVYDSVAASAYNANKAELDLGSTIRSVFSNAKTFLIFDAL